MKRHRFSRRRPRSRGWLSGRVSSRCAVGAALIAMTATVAAAAPVVPGAFDHVDSRLVQRLEAGEGVEGFPIAPITAANPDSLDILNVDLELRVNPVTEQIIGRSTLTIRSVHNGLTHAVIDLHDSLAVSAVRRDGVPIAFSRVGATIDASLGATYPAGGEFDLTIDYAGHSPTLGNKGLRFDVHAGVRMGYTLSTPYSTAFATTVPISSRWRPCKDRGPADKSTATLHFTVPDTFLASSNGIPAGVVPNGDGTATYHWNTNYPVSPHLICFATTNYDTIRDVYTTAADATMPVIHHVLPEQLSIAREAFSRVPEMIGALAARFGEYPFIAEKYGMTVVRGSTAVENQTNSAMPMSLVRSDHTYDWIYLHELAHQWWGDCVAVRDWSHVWLSEGFATYAEALWMESRGGQDSLRAWMETKDDGPFTGTLVNPSYVWVNTVYNKGAWVLHMLRHVMGDTAFFGALADYRTGHEHDAAVTDDFQAALEARYGASLDWFFGPWVYGVGTPRYALAWNSTAVGDSFRVRVEIRQTQPLSEPTYTMPIDLRIATAAGPVDVVAWNDARAEAFSFMTAAAPSAVTLDPGHWVLQVVDPFPTSVATHDPGDVAGSRPLPDLTVSPNPARDAVMMALRAPQDAPAELAIHDVRGRLIRWWRLPAGFEEVRAIPWDRRDDAGRRVGPGIYFARLSVGAGSVERKILLLP